MVQRGVRDRNLQSRPGLNQRFVTQSSEADKDFFIAINYSDFDKFIDVPFSVNGHWDDLLNEQSAVVENFRLFKQRIHSNWGWIYFKKG